MAGGSAASRGNPGATDGAHLGAEAGVPGGGKARKHGSETRKRSKTVTVRLTPVEMALVRAISERMGCAPSTLLREVTLSLARGSRAEAPPQ